MASELDGQGGGMGLEDISSFLDFLSESDPQSLEHIQAMLNKARTRGGMLKASENPMPTHEGIQFAQIRPDINAQQTYTHGGSPEGVTSTLDASYPQGTDLPLMHDAFDPGTPSSYSQLHKDPTDFSQIYDFLDAHGEQPGAGLKSIGQVKTPDDLIGPVQTTEDPTDFSSVYNFLAKRGAQRPSVIGPPSGANRPRNIPPRRL